MPPIGDGGFSETVSTGPAPLAIVAELAPARLEQLAGVLELVGWYQVKRPTHSQVNRAGFGVGVHSHSVRVGRHRIGSVWRSARERSHGPPADRRPAGRDHWRMDEQDHRHKQLLEHVAELEQTLDRAKHLAADLPRGREAALVATKIDEARLWLGRVPLETA